MYASLIGGIDDLATKKRFRTLCSKFEGTAETERHAKWVTVDDSSSRASIARMPDKEVLDLMLVFGVLNPDLFAWIVDTMDARLVARAVVKWEMGHREAFLDPLDGTPPHDIVSYKTSFRGWKPGKKVPSAWCADSKGTPLLLNALPKRYQEIAVKALLEADKALQAKKRKRGLSNVKRFK